MWEVVSSNTIIIDQIYVGLYILNLCINWSAQLLFYPYNYGTVILLANSNGNSSFKRAK